MNYNGILIIDKPSGWTSHDVVAKLRGALRVKRIGHGGTLDPMATGVLPVFIGRATRAAEFCENAEKEYIAGLRLGIVTDTQDITGQTLSDCEVSLTKSDLEGVIPSFLGSQKQIPPMYSAIKQGGKKLYELARRGIDVPRPARDIHISAIELLNGGGNEFELRIVCSKGTYIRTLCHDIGASLGCGGTMSSLRRTKAGVFSLEMAKALDEVLSAVSAGEAWKLIMPVDSLFMEFPSATLCEDDARGVKNGRPCRATGLAELPPDGRHRFYGPDNEFLMLGDVVADEIKIVKGFFEV